MPAPAALSRFVARVDALDRRAMAAAVRVRRGWLTPVVIAVSNSGTGVVWFTAAGLFVLLARLDVLDAAALTPVLGAMVGAFGSLVTGQAIKRGVGRPRPFSAIEGYEVLGRPPRDLSMPSTHSSTAVALVTQLAWIGHPAAPAIGLWALGVVGSRLYLGVHFPSDLVAGSLLGVLFGMIDCTPIAALMLG